MKYYYLFYWAVLFISCSQPSTEKYHKSRDNIVNVKVKIVEIPMDSIPCNNLSGVSVFQDKFIITDIQSYDCQIHLFDHKTFRHLASTAQFGQGPKEITNMGETIFHPTKPEFYVEDLGKLVLFRYNLDSVLADPTYEPSVWLHLQQNNFPIYSRLINDTLMCSVIMQPTGKASHNRYTTLFNLNTGEIVPFEDLHPEIKRKRYSIAISMKHNLLVENYQRQNLLVLRNLNDGSLRYNVRGYEPSDGWERRIEYYVSSPFICKDKIVSVYKEDPMLTTSGNPQVTFSTRLILFTLDGDYIQTLETGYQINDLCYDEEMNRIIFSFNDEIQFGYLDMEGIL